MSARRLASLELRRLAAGRITRLALVAAALVPLLYGALSIYANWDPYQRLSAVPAAIVMADDGAVGADGGVLDAGVEVERQLIEAGDFDWRRVSPEEADQGVAAGRYGFALVVPPDFSSALMSHAAVDPRAARLTVITNDANNHLLGTVAEQLAERVRSTVATQVGRQTADRLLLSLNTVYEQTAAASTEADELTESTGELIAALVIAQELLAETAELAAEEAFAAQDRAEQAVDLADAAGVSATDAASLGEGAAALEAGGAALREVVSRIRDHAEAVDGQSTSVASAAAAATGLTESSGLLAEAAGEVAGELPSIRRGLAEEFTRLGQSDETIETMLADLDALAGRAAEVDGAADGLAGGLSELTGAGGSMQDAVAALSAAAGDLSSSVAAADAGVDVLVDDGARVADAVADLAESLALLADDAVEQREAQAAAAVAADAAAEQTEVLVGGAVELLELTEGVDGTAFDLADRLAEEVAQIPNVDAATRQAAAQTIASPVTVTDRTHLTAGSHGAGLAPLFLGLALWVGAVVSYLLLRPLSARALAANVPAWRVALGGWLPAAVLGLAQAVTLFIATVLVIGLPAVRPWAVLGLLVVTALAFTGIAHALCAAFGPAGRLLALVALVLQLTTAGSVFPWLTMPEVLHPLHRMLPLGYVVDGLRHLLYGGDVEPALLAVLVCLIWLLLAFVVAVTAAMRRRVWTPGQLRPEIAW
ncbi:YhgE/Pip family protein [Actinoalloteichus sp. GBA129-24]|uniref:YhgE/Pip family protein n=1 Tax=Actinoalloteichus sp. GBA129-24 TaxID=1612551 RepID=UPI000950891D|nr:YhgE/Pip family protein [Actinoalloteichus sp. GBA129-24]APU20158.1 YhgE/Pip-like protein [Actinoalloteichus sp. GBA129-24]